ncbi:MAG: DEAD/DEAH box helicase family protein, partial [Nitrospirae bacterium]|nr:DEAD/DEAH box helicase family protein [Nitrospirota bacterium]
NTILDQTADALRDPRHPYRLALESECGTVEVVTIEEALRLSRATVEGQTVVIVATIQSFRVEDTTGRKVYGQNGAFAEHLLNVPPDRLADLLPGADGKPKPSLVNMLRLRRPIVIVDEAHNARTDLSFATLGNVLPSCIIEFTATPALKGTPSNVLYHVSAMELKAASMVKLPLRVITRHPSQCDQLLSEAITLRTDLERLAAAEGQATGEYLRPILLIQAERVDACEPLRDRLVHEFGIAKDEIKISVGILDELKGIQDVASPKCPVRIILTVQKLREGWDCPFAYVLCSLRETRSATAIEQIVGRILRLPGAQEKRHPDLNCAYAFSVSESLPEVLNELREALVSNGFTTAEAERIIIPIPVSQGTLGSQPRIVRIKPADFDAAETQVQASELSDKVRIDPVKGEVTVLVPLDEAETEKLTRCVKTSETKARLVETVVLLREAEKAFGGSGRTRVPTPYERQLDFRVPILCVQENGQLFEFESTFLLEHPWKLSEKDASLSDGYNPLDRPAGRAGMVDVGARGEVTTQVLDQTDFVATLHQQAFQFGGEVDWSIEELVTWLDRHIDHQDIPIGESAEFLRKVIRGQTAKHGITDLGLLVLDRFRLRDEIEGRIQQHRDSERKEAFQMFLLPDSMLTVSDKRAINFKTMIYEPSWLYEGGFQFRKHYFGPKPGELREKTPAGELTEEFRCAQFIDGLPEVQFWVRNLPRKSTSFRLQTSKDWFYPDFLCQLTNNRILVVEYKGKHLYDAADAEEKRLVGQVWASRSNRRGLFVMPTEGDFSVIKNMARTAKYPAIQEALPEAADVSRPAYLKGHNGPNEA